MGYTALYRKFRPDSFADVKGQDHIVTTLKNQIKAERIGHAYLFCGTRGTGKTTVAKILAKAVNCERPKEGNPCNECETCQTISAGASMNVIEIDAASNNGVDNIREIREEVTYSPTTGKYKVYIIDEVHMLSMGAFNALLKTLEEPPAYVIFILATTEAHKIPITILSRCQRYDFKRIELNTIAQRLQQLVVEEQVEVEEKALRYIAKKADGSMRDALSLLDQCIAFYLGQKLTYDHVLEVLGAVDTEEFSKLLREIIKGDVVRMIAHLEELVMQGRELSQFVIDFTWYMRNLLLLKSSEDMEDVLDISTENRKLLQEEAKQIRDDTLMRYIRIFSELSNQLRYAAAKRVLLEVALIKLCKPQMETDEVSLLERIRMLEKQIQQGLIVQQPQDHARGNAEVSKAIESPDDKSIQRETLEKAAPEDFKQVQSMWASIVGQTQGRFKVVLSSARVKYNANEDDKRLFVVFADFLAESYIGNEASKKELEEIIAARIGKYMEVKMILEAEEHLVGGTLSGINIDDIIKNNINMEVEVED